MNAVRRMPLLTRDRSHDDKAYKLPGHDLPWQEWLKRFFPHVCTAPLAKRHINLWTWFDNLRRGTKPPPEIEIWARGSAKSSTAELGCTRLGVTLERRFVLYVCEIQDQADSHVQTISTHLEAVGARPLLNKMGRARGWRRNQLRTANGFNVAAFGMENAQRGIKIDEFRPDLIILDDIDDRHDSIEQVNKKIEFLTQTIFPSGSSDCAILLVENLVHSNSISSMLYDGRAKFLLNRIVPTPVPAIEGLEYDTYTGENGLDQYRITAGVATWEGQPLETCEAQMVEWGIDAFIREAQHDVRHSGDLYFPKFQGIDHFGPGRDGRHIAKGRDIPTYWNWFAGYDDGRYNPCALVLFAISPPGYIADGVETVFAVEEMVAGGLSPSERAVAVEKLFLKYALRPEDVPIYADPGTWSKQVGHDKIGRAPVEAFFEIGLNMIQANNNRAHGLDNLVEYVGQEHAFKIIKGRCPELCRQFATGVHDKDRVEDLDDDADILPSHNDAISAARYGLNSRPISAMKPKKQIKTFFNGVQVMPLQELPPELATDELDDGYSADDYDDREYGDDD